MTDPRSAAQTAIAQAGFSAATERNAMRLLARASEQDGHYRTDWATLCTLFDCSQAVVRRHLGYIAASGIIHYSSNMWVYINFLAWQPSTESTKNVHPVDEKRAWARDEETEPAEIVHSVDEKRAWARDNETPDAETSDADRPLNARKTRVGARKTYTEWTIGGDNRGGRLVGSNLTTLPGKNLIPTNPPVTRPRWEVESSEGLLLALGCENLPAIRETARTFPFEDVRAHALAWQRDTKSQSPGGLLHRIRSGNFAVPEITSADRESSIFLRWRTPAELTAEEERERQAIEENQRWEERRAAANPPPAAPDPEPDTHRAEPLEPDKIWKAALTDLAQSLPAQTFETWVRDTDVLRYEDGEFVIGVPRAQARDWLHNRLRPQIQRTLSRITQRSTDVSFAVRPRGD